MQIIGQTPGLPKHRRRDLISLKRTSKLFSRLAFEALLHQPLVQISNVHRFVRLYFQNPHLTNNVTELEFLTNIPAFYAFLREVEPDHQDRVEEFAPESNSPFKVFCLGAIAESSLSTTSQAQWTRGLVQDYQNVFACLLLVLLPNLVTLRLGLC